MKKIPLFILLAGLGFVSYSCSSNDDAVVENPVDYDTYSVMTDATGTFAVSNGYTLSMDISIKSTDVVLVYRRVGNYWQSIPKTYYLDNVVAPATGRELDYNFDFNTNEVNIRVAANFNLASMSPMEVNQYLGNQTFRIVLVPASEGTSSAGKKANGVDYNDYNAVVKYYNLDDSKVPVIKVKK